MVINGQRENVSCGVNPKGGGIHVVGVEWQTGVNGGVEGDR